MKIKSSPVFSSMVAFIDCATQMFRIPTIHAYLASVGAPERWRVTFLRTSGFVVMLMLTSPLLKSLEQVGEVRGLVLALCLIKALSNIMYSIPLTYLSIYFAEVINMSIRIVLLSLVSCGHISSGKNGSHYQAFLKVSKPLGVLIGALCSVLFEDFEINMGGLRINALNISGMFSALLWILVMFVACFTKFSEESLNGHALRYSLLSNEQENKDLASRPKKNYSIVGFLVAIFESLKTLFNRKSYVVLYFNYCTISFAHILLILIIIIFPRDFFHWDVHYGCLAAVAYGIVDVIAVTMVTYMADTTKSSNSLFILYGLVSNFLGLICLIAMTTERFWGNISAICFFLGTILVNSGFAFTNHGVMNLFGKSAKSSVQSFGFLHIANIYLIPRILSSSISGIMLDYLVSYCATLDILLLFGIAAFLVYWGEFEDV